MPAPPGWTAHCPYQRQQQIGQEDGQQERQDDLPGEEDDQQRDQNAAAPPGRVRDATAPAPLFPSGRHVAIVVVAELQTHSSSATFSNVNSAARLHRLLVILSMSTARPGIRVDDLAGSLNVSTRTVFRDLAELQRLGFPVSFGNGYPAQQELFRRRRKQAMSQVMADLVDQQLEVVRRKLPADQAERVINDAIQYLPLEAAEAVTRALARAARK